MTVGMIVIAGGCGRKPVELVPVSGILKVAGVPEGDIEVQFMPESESGDHAPTSYGISDVDGRFELRVRDGRVGAVPGQHRVFVTDVNEERPAQGESFTRPPRIHSRYGTIAGGLNAEVSRTGDLIEIDIPSVRKSH
jgi:hypothetical protein